MPVFKNKTQGQYVNVCKDILKNSSLSLRDRGMVVTLLSLPDNWDFNIAGLSKIIPDGKSAIRASLTNLEQMGYLSREQERTGNGKFGRNIIEIHETPIEIASKSDLRTTDISYTENRMTEKPLTEKRTQYINNKYNNNKCTNNQSINQYVEDRETDVEQLRDVIADNIHLIDFYEVAGTNKQEHEMVREVYDTICDVVCIPRETVTIKGTKYPWYIVKNQFMKLNAIHMANVLERLVDSTLQIKNMKAYLVSTLYAESLSGTLKEQSNLHDDYLRFLRGNPYQNIT